MSNIENPNITATVTSNTDDKYHNQSTARTNNTNDKYHNTNTHIYIYIVSTHMIEFT